MAMTAASLYWNTTTEPESTFSVGVCSFHNLLCMKSGDVVCKMGCVNDGQYVVAAIQILVLGSAIFQLFLLYLLPPNRQ